MKRILSLFLAALLCLSLLPMGALADGTTVGLGVAKRTKTEIRRFAESHPVLEAAVAYDAEPQPTAPYAAGQLSASTQRTALNAVNLVRYIAGLSANVTLDAGYTEMEQAAALVNAVNGGLSHSPSQPAGMEDDLYQLGYDGASRGNLAAGYENLVRGIFFGWMYDSDASNIDRLGHRRWILNPPMGKTGLGYVGTYSAMYAFDTSGGGGETMVAWPAQTMPTALFQGNQAWSLSVGENVVSVSVTVTLTRRSDGRVWNFAWDSADGDFYVDNGGYGQKGCIIFRPEGIEKYAAGDHFDVRVTGAGEKDIAYSVDFFDMDDLLFETPKLWVETNDLKIYTGETAELRYGYSGDSLGGLFLGKKWASRGNPGPMMEEYTDDHMTIRGEGPGIGTLQLSLLDWGSGEVFAEETVTVLVLDREKSLTEAKVKLSKSSYAYDGKAKKPTPTVTLNGVKLTKGTDYTVSYKNNKKVGTATVTITGKGDYSGTVKATFKINPKAPTLSSVKNTAAKKATVKWKKVAGVTGYQIQYSTSKKFTAKTTKSVTVKGAAKVSKALTKLTKGKTYYVRVRTYQLVSATKYYSAWSAVKTVKIKK